MASHPDEAVNKRKHVDYDQKCVIVEERKGGATEACRRGYPREDTPPAQCSVLCGPRSCSTLPSSMVNQSDGGTSPPEPKRRRLWGLRGLVKMFRRRVKRKAGVDPAECSEAPAPTLRARSASELTVDPNNRTSSGPYNQGLSVSHDSVFSPESPTEQTHTAPPGLSLATRGVNMSELKAALRRRRGLDSGSVEDDPDDPGLPRSPPTSPTTLDVLNHGLKSSSRGGQSSCSDGSLLSMGSSENDEDSFGLISHHSSKHSLIEGRHQIVDHEPAVGAAPLSHKAARHKISVRPKRTHGIPRARKQAQSLTSSLPTTPEVNEDLTVRSGASAHNASFTPPFKHQENQRPSSISFSSIETQMIKTKSEVTEERRNLRKSLPEPSSSHPEEKRDEPLLNRLFGSARSGQQQQQQQQRAEEESRADSLTPSDGSRVSREKRKDPFRTSSGAKSSRQKSDPSRFSYTQQQEFVPQPAERNGSSHRSSSVEGRLEGNPFDDSLEQQPSRQYELVEGEVPYMLREEESEVILRRAVMVERKEATSSKGVIVNRLSSSYDSLDNDDMLPDGLMKKHSINSLESCEGRSSTDSLTTTPLPGIYIRSNHSLTKLRRKSLQNQTKESIARRREEDSQCHQYPHYERDYGISGPMSLDSSLSAVQYEEELRKYASVDEVNGFGESKHPLPPSSRPVTVLRSASVHSSTSSRGSSARSRKSSIGDELESDSSLPRVSLRKVKRDSSLKKAPEETETEAVPEFMRIQLNRVQNKGNTVIFDTEQQTAKPPSTTHRTSPVAVQPRVEPLDSIPSKQKAPHEETEKPKEQSEIIVEKNNLIEMTSKEISPSANNKLPETTNVVTAVTGTPVTTQPVSSKGGPPKAQNEEQQRKKDEIILRRPSVVDRAIVIDQTMGTLPSSPTPTKDGEEPELFKVFARRSFKLKDAEFESMMHGEPNSEMDKENHVPASYHSSIDGDQIANKKNDRSNNTSTPTLKSISAKRYSLGSVIPPFVSPIDHKPTMIVLSGNVVGPTENPETKALVDNKMHAESGTIKSGLKAKEKIQNASVFERSKSQSPHTLHSEGSIKAEMDGSFSSSSEDNVEMSNKPTARVKKVNSFSKTGVQRYSPNTTVSPGTQQRQAVRSGDSFTSSAPRDIETASPSFNSAIIRRSTLTTSTVSTSPSESSSTDGSQSPVIPSTKPFRGQTVIWPPRYQSSNPSDSVGESPPRTDVIRPSGKVVSPFIESRSPVGGGTELQTSSEVESSSRVVTPVTGSTETRKQSLKESGKEGRSVLAEARNTTFSHSFDASSTHLGPYLGRNETPHKIERKGSADEGRNSIGGAEDWRVLVRQRREDRMKQTKTPEAEEIIIEARPSVSRSSKVLEMANNFQKLQVA